MADQVPTNAEIQKGVKQAKQEIEAAKQDTEGINAVGKQILDDTKQLVDTAGQYITQKNKGDVLKKLAIEADKAIEELQDEAKKLQSNVQEKVEGELDLDEVKNLSLKVIDTARSAGMEIVTSNEFRNNLTEFIGLINDFVTDSVKNVGPSGKQQEIEGDLQKGKQKIEQGDYKGAAKDAAQKGLKHGQDIAEGAKEGAEKAVSNVKEKGKELKEKEEVESKDVKEMVEGAVNPVLKNTGVGMRVDLSEEQMDELYGRWMKLINNITKRDSSKQFYNNLFELMDLVKEQSKKTKEVLKDEVSETSERVSNKRHLNRALSLARQFLNNLLGSEKSLDTIIDNFNDMCEAINDDPEINKYFNDLYRYWKQIINHPEALKDEAQSKELMNRGKNLILRGRKLNNEKLYDSLRSIVKETKATIRNFEEDPLNLKLKSDLQRLVQDVAMDRQGNLTYKPEVLDQLKLIIVSAVVERLQIPLPDIHMESDDMEWTLSNLVLNLSDILPDKVLIDNRGQMLLDLSDPTKPEIAKAANAFRLAMANINLHVPKADIWFRRKTFPKLEDEGKASIDIGGRGLDLVIVIQTFLQGPDFFAVQGVDVNVHNLALHFSKTQHDTVYNTLVKMFSGSIKDNIAESIQNGIRDTLSQLNITIRDSLVKANANVGQSLLADNLDKVKQGAQLLIEKTVGSGAM